VAFPLVAGYGRRSDNPSIQPLDYSRGLLITLAAVWLAVVTIALVHRVNFQSGPNAGQRKLG